jgi:DNA recombination-dependent growth factor C
MGLLSSTISLTRYKVEGKAEEPVLETIGDRLKKNAVPEIDDDSPDKAIGWTSFQDPFRPNFEGSSFVVGPYLVFSMRIDKKTIPSKIVKKHYALEASARLAETGREHLSRSEKQEIKEHVLNVLSLRIPATPNIYDLLWDLENGLLWFFSNQKGANEEMETLFTKSFKLSLIRLFPYTLAELDAGLSDGEREVLSKLVPTRFTE